MSCAIPRDLDSQWFLSDVVLLAENAEGRELHVSRALLSSASPVFRAMFSSSFKESNEDRILISSDYETLKDALRFVNHLECHCCLTTLFDEESLFSTYVVADMWDFPIVKKAVLKMTKEYTPNLHKEIQATFGIQNNVPCAIPENFDASWFLSNAEVVSREGERFHVSKTMLSLGSSLFRDQFLVQKNSSVELPISSDILKEIFHQMHHVHCDCSHKVTDPDTLLQVHLAANWLNIPSVKEKSLPQLERFPEILEDETREFIQGEPRSLISVCHKLNPDELLTFLSSDDPRPLFSKEDVSSLFKIAPKKKTVEERKVVDLHLEAERTKNMVVLVFTQPCFFTNLAIRVKNSDRTIYARKEVLMGDSEFFRRKFLENDWSEGKTPEGYDIITMDEEWPALYRIVGVVHFCKPGIDSSLSAPFLYDLYQSASEERFDVPLVRELCLKAIIDGAQKKTGLSYLEVAIRLKLKKEINLVLEKIMKDSLKMWLEGSSVAHSYVKDGEEIVFEVKPNEYVFSAKDVRTIYERLSK